MFLSSPAARPDTAALPVLAPPPVAQPALQPSGLRDRRRTGRSDHVSPELVGLLRNPASRSARVRVALYDAPGFLLPQAHQGPRPGPSLFHMAVALVACSAACATAFKAMLFAWG